MEEKKQLKILISENISNLVENFVIKPGYRSDHSAVILGSNSIHSKNAEGCENLTIFYYLIKLTFKRSKTLYNKCITNIKLLLLNPLRSTIS